METPATAPETAKEKEEEEESTPTPVDRILAVEEAERPAGEAESEANFEDVVLLLSWWLSPVSHLKLSVCQRAVIAIHNHDEVRVLLLDYRKAFDLVDHNILIEKFASFRIHEILLRWLHAFLSDRQQRLKLDQDVSDWLSMQAAMPQGAYLGPLSFVVRTCSTLKL